MTDLRPSDAEPALRSRTRLVAGVLRRVTEGRARLEFRAAVAFHGRRLRKLNSGGAGYGAYLQEQLERSLSKRSNDPGVGARLLVEKVVDSLELERRPRVLCLGCRNGIELDEFRRRGVLEVVGVDLFSQRRDILVMDMHDLGFAEDTFDGVYAAHALEHSFDLDKVLQQIARVARPGAVVGVEVPVRHKGSDADLIEFGGLDDLRSSLACIVDRTLWTDEQLPRSSTNDQGSAVARVVFTVRKQPLSV